MIDLHSHLLPGCDDGAKDLTQSLDMARIAVEDGVRVMACTPHIVPGLYENDAISIKAGVKALRDALSQAGIPLRLVVGADVHVVPDLVEQLLTGKIPTLNRSRYFLFEPPHHVLLPRLEDLAAAVLERGFVPILTHPERLTWIRKHYDVLERLNALGCLIQVTASAFTGQFGGTAQALALRLLNEGRVDLVASDAHNVTSRRPGLSKERDVISELVGPDEAKKLVLCRPLAIIRNQYIKPAGHSSRYERVSYLEKKQGIWTRLRSRIGS